MKTLLALLLLIPSLSWGELIICENKNNKDIDKFKYIEIYDGRIMTAITMDSERRESDEVKNFYKNNKLKYAVFHEDEYFNNFEGTSFDKELSINIQKENFKHLKPLMEEVVDLYLLFNEGKRNKLDKYLLFAPTNWWQVGYAKDEDVEQKWIMFDRYNLHAVIIRDWDMKKSDLELWDDSNVENFVIDGNKAKRYQCKIVNKPEKQI